MLISEAVNQMNIIHLYSNEAAYSFNNNNNNYNKQMMLNVS